MIRRTRSKAGTAQDATDRRVGWLAAALGLLAALAVAVPAAGQSAPGAATLEPPAVVSSVVHRSAAKIREYWTPERMREAEPIGPRSPSEPAMLDRDTGEPTGAPELVLPSGRGIPETAGGLLDGILGGGDPQPRDAVDSSADSKAFPERVHGKVFLTISGGLDPGNYLCSGTVVRSPSHTVVWTAGHCVFDALVAASGGDEGGGGFVTNFEFVPGYRSGDRPFGEWVAKELFTTPGWGRSPPAYGDFSYDVGAAVMHRDGNGRGIQDAVGSRGIAFNQPRNQTFKAFGYPAQPTLFRPEFNGQHLFACTSPKIGDDNAGSGPLALEINCDMTGGASGGGWVVESQFVNSVTSYSYTFDSDSLFGPYFGTTIKNLYKDARGKKTKCAGEEVTNLGGRAADDFDGTAGADSFRLRRGPDTGDGGAGRDLLCGGKGKDLLIGGPGFDVCNGGKGRDRARGCEQRRKIR